MDKFMIYATPPNEPAVIMATCFTFFAYKPIEYHPSECVLMLPFEGWDCE